MQLRSLAPVLALSVWLLGGCGRLYPPAAEEPALPPLVMAAESGDLGQVNELLEETADPDVRDFCQWTPLMKAASRGHTEVAIRLLQEGAGIDLEDKGSYTALQLAASNNYSDIVALMLNYGADVNHQERTEGNSALLWAAKLGHLQAVNVLLAHRADPNLRDRGGMTALDWASRNGHTEVAHLLAGYSP